MDRLTFNRKLNSLISDFLEGGGDPAYCADVLRDIADEVFEKPKKRRVGHHRLCDWDDCQGGCWDLYYESV